MHEKVTFSEKDVLARGQKRKQKARNEYTQQKVRCEIRL